MKSSYDYVITDDTDICHVSGSTDIVGGHCATILRHFNNNHKDFRVHQNVVLKIMGSQKKMDLVFLQASPPAAHFETYDKESWKLPIPLRAYIQLLEFIKGDFKVLKSKFELDAKALRIGNAWLKKSDNILVRKGCNIFYKHPIDSGVGWTLFLFILYNPDSDVIQRMALMYDDCDLGEMPLFLTTLTKLAKDLPVLKVILNYKDPMQPLDVNQLVIERPNANNEKNTSGEGNFGGESSQCTERH